MKEPALTPEELQLFKRRDFVIKSVVTLPFIGILWRLWDLQINEGQKYNELSKGNRIRLKSIPAPRGIIYDRSGVVLAKNIPSFNLMIVREDTNDVPGVLRKVSHALRIPYEDMIQAVEEKKGYAKFQSIQIYKGLSQYQMAVVSAYQDEFPGISIEVSPQRYYPRLFNGSHIYGYLTKISKSQLKRLPANKVQSAQRVGQEGIERIYNKDLIGIDGGVQVEVDSTGRILQTLRSIDPIPGADLHLTISAKLQQRVGEIFGDQTGAAILMDPNNGAIRAMVSLPSFDPNEFSRGISRERWQDLITDPTKVLSNKCIQGIYSPGSTFKMLVAAAGLEEGLIDANTEHFCEGQYRYNNLQVHCWKRSGHGPLNVTAAIENSCNIFFYKLAIELGIDKIHEYANRFGLGKLSGIDLLHEKSGMIPNKKWKEEFMGEPWYPGDTLPASIGQGFVSVTPLQLLTYISAIANSGYLVKPRIVEMIEPNVGETFFANPKDIPRTIRKGSIRTNINISPTTIKLLQQGMIRNVNGAHGTGSAARTDSVSIAGKTGTVQVISLGTLAKLEKNNGLVDKRYRDHAWFASFAPAENPRIASVVLIEHGVSGSNAARLTQKIYEYYFREIDPLPQPTPPEIETPVAPTSKEINT